MTHGVSQLHKPRVHVALLPELVQPHQLDGSVAVVIDVLRATTTICAALAAGCRQVIPCLEVDETRRASEQFERPILGGERGGLPIDGFDLGNSPTEYTPERVRGRTVIFTTTNGTRAILRCCQAERIVICAFSNLSAVVREIAGSETIHIVCAGTEGNVSMEDVLLAGAIVERLSPGGNEKGDYELDDGAELARALWNQSGGQRQGILNVLRASRGGRNLRQIGLETDLSEACRVDRFDTAPQFDPATGSIRLDR